MAARPNGVVALLAWLSALAGAGCPPAASSPQSATAPAATSVAGRVAPAEVTTTLADVSPARVKAIVAKLASFGTRHTLSDPTSTTRGIGAARSWIEGELAAIGAASGRSGDLSMQVAHESYVLAADGARIPREIELVNVVAVLPGAMPEARARRYIVVGHYDSRATDVMDATSDAPGANDDASGVAVALEAARVMSKHRWDATLVFLATAGEEQGLHGAKAHAKAARAAGLDVRAVLNDDIVGDPSSPRGGRYAGAVRVFSEGIAASADLAEVRKLAIESDSPSRQIARFTVEIADLHRLDVRPVMVFRPDRFLRGGDHLAFNEVGYPAVRFTTVEETFERQHQDVREERGVRYGDDPEHVDASYLAGVTRLNVATLAHLANAPSPPAEPRIVTADLAIDTLLRWSRSPEPDVAGYEVVWRASTSPIWTDRRDVGNVTEARIPIGKDDVFFGLRAYDRDGYVSPVVFARAAAR